MEQEASRTYRFNERVGEPATMRSMSLLIDLMVIWVLVSLPTVPVLIMTLSNDGPIGLAIGAWVVMFVIAHFAYNVLCEGLAGTTLGKRFGMWPMSLCVVRTSGGRPGFAPAATRALVSVFEQSNLVGWIVGAIAIATSPTNQRLADRVADTLVVDRSKAQTVTFDPHLVTFRMLDGRVLQLSRLTSGYVTTWLGKPQWLKIEGANPQGSPLKLAFRMTKGVTVFNNAQEVQWLRTELERRFQTSFENRLETWRFALIAVAVLIALLSACGPAFFIPILMGM